jgi:type IV pilus assembly protein PilF
MKPRSLRAQLLTALYALVMAGCAAVGQNGKPVDNKEAAIANMQLGVRYMKDGQLQLAKDKLERAEKQDPRNYEVHWAMAQLMELIDQPAEAERYYQTAMKLSPDNSSIANIYAVFLCKSNKVDKALPLFEVVIRDKLYPAPWVAATNAAVCLRADKRNADALVYLDGALSQRKDYIPAVLEKADLQLAIGKPALARQTVDNYLALPRKPPELAQLLLIGVRAAQALGERPAADNYARLLRRDFPGSPQTQSLPQLLQDAK